MKRIIFLIPLILFLGTLAETPIVFGQALSATTIKAGYFNPKASKAGFVFGGSYSWIIDESVDIGIAVDYFRRNYPVKTAIAEPDLQGGLKASTYRVDAEFTYNIIPIYGVINIKFPAGTYLDYFLSGGVGYEMLIYKAKTFGDKPYDKSNYYDGFKWLLSAGIMYRIGSRSSFLAELFYDGTKVTKDKKVEEGAPAKYYDEVNLSGIGIRIGVRMGLH